MGERRIVVGEFISIEKMIADTKDNAQPVVNDFGNLIDKKPCPMIV